MVSGVSPTNCQYTPVQVEQLSPLESESGRKSRVGAAIRRDTVSISPEARAVLQEEQERAGTSLWESKYGYRNGTTILKNGHSQVVTIKDSHLTVQEFSGDALVREENAEVTADGLTRDITLYDKRGNVTQTMHSTLQNGVSTKPRGTFATLTRSAQWFENGVLVRDMQENMELEAEYTDVDWMNPELLPKADNLEDMKKYMTFNDIAFRYDGSVAEYEEGRLARQMSVSKGSQSQSISNRHDSMPVGSLKAGTSWEVGGKNSFFVSMTTYDTSGRLASEMLYTDVILIGKERKQHLAMSIYKDGELVSSSVGDMATAETPVTEVRQKPRILDDLGLKQDEFAGAKELTAQEMLSLRFMESSETPGYYLSRAVKGQTSGDGASLVPHGRGGAKPYSIEWTNETYVDGKLTARQVDTEKSTVNTQASKNPFAPGKGLTEDENPPVLRGSGHVLELYKQGSLSTRKESQAHEVIGYDRRGVASLGTHSRVNFGPESSRDELWGISELGLGEADQEARAASENMDRDLGWFLAGVRGMIEGTETTRRADDPSLPGLRRVPWA